MEGLIIMAVIALLTRLFAGNNDDKKKKKPTSSMPPFSNDKPSSKPVQKPTSERKAAAEVKSLEDFANEVFGQLQQKAQPNTTSKEVEKVPVEVTVERSITTERPSLQVRAESIRPSIQERKEQLGAERSILQRNKNKKAIAIPTTRQELVQSIVMADILAKPISQRKNRL